MEQSLFDAVGGEEFFVKLVDGFYVGIESDEVLRPMYVDQDLTESRRHLTLFLQQYWGGPSIYQAERGTQDFACATCHLLLMTMLEIAGFTICTLRSPRLKWMKRFVTNFGLI